MTHIHEVLDTDKHFIIDACTGELVNYTPEKNIRQFAHNSERLTFELPRFIDGHDMTTCNVVEVHYINAGTTAKNPGLYIVNDFVAATNEAGEEIVKCSWLVSKNATQLAGKLLFRLNFICSNGGEIDYLWPTAIYSGINVADGINNTDYVVDNYADILVAFDDRLRQLENLDMSCYIKTVNGLAPDENGNVEVPFTRSGTGQSSEVFNSTTNVASGNFSHAEGIDTVASGTASHAEGCKWNSTQTVASAEGAHAEGRGAAATGTGSHAEGILTSARGSCAHAEGESTVAYATGSHAEGRSTKAGGKSDSEIGGAYSHAEGISTIAYGRGSHAEGESTLAQAQFSHAEGGGCQATGDYSHAEGCNSGNTKTTASAIGAHAEGRGTTASASGSHSEGELTTASGISSHSEGESTLAQGKASHAEGGGCQATGDYSHAEGCNSGNISTTAYGKGSHAEGIGTWARGEGSHTEGKDTSTSKNYAHAEGESTTASGVASHSEGKGTIATGDCQHVQGKYNAEDTAKKYAHIVGGGSSESDRKNIHTVDWSGVAWFAGGIKIGGTSQDDPNAKSVLTSADMQTIIDAVKAALPVYAGEVEAV